MRRTLRLAAALLATVAFALIGATAVVAGNSDTTYTCTKSKKNGETDVRVSVPEPSVNGLTDAGFSCVSETPPSDDEDVATDEDPGNHSPPENDTESKAQERSSSTVTVEVPSESRSLYCSTTGPVERGNAEGPGVALNLPESQGALLVRKGLATPGIFYAGIGVSCDLLPGFTYSGVWVDHVGDAVPGIAVYPYYIPTTS